MTNPNLALLEEAVELLEPLLNEFVFRRWMHDRSARHGPGCHKHQTDT